MFALVLAVLSFEGWRAWNFYRDVASARSALLSLRSELQLDTLRANEDETLAIRQRLATASKELHSAKKFVDYDPFVFAASLIPVVGKNASSLRHLVHAADDSAKTGLLAADVLLDFNHAQDAAGSTSIQNAISFVRSEEARMRDVESGIERIRQSRRALSAGLIGPLESARQDLDDALAKLSNLADGYDRADRLLPSLLGYDGPKRFLVLPQNDTELFPSGGLISNYGIATFDSGKLADIQFEYFVNLFDRWQKQSGGEYVEPPAPLKNYLLRDVSWGLGEAGWYPDFPTTARLAESFVQKGGVPPTDGTIALDLKFVAGLLEFLGPVTVPAYGVTVNASNLSDVTLEQTRGESSLPGTPGKAFLSALAKELLTGIFSTPRDKWVGLLKLLDRMAQERHLQIYFADPAMESLSHDYHLDGAIANPPGDFLLVADTSVQSTKLNLILQTAIKVDVQLSSDRSASTLVIYDVANPLPQWRAGKDPGLVKALMLDGVYGSYLRLYAHAQAQLKELTIDGVRSGAEQINIELGHGAFGRFFPVLPGEAKRILFAYVTPSVVDFQNGVYRYSLYIQKEPGTGATPLAVQVTLPRGSVGAIMQLDDKVVGGGLSLSTDLTTDRKIDVEFRLK